MPSKPGKPRLAERVDDRGAVGVVDGRRAAVDGRVDVLRAEERLEARVAARLVGQRVGLRVPRSPVQIGRRRRRNGSRSRRSRSAPARVPRCWTARSASVRPSTHSGEPAPKTLVMSPVGSVAVTADGDAARVCLRQRAVRVTPVRADGPTCRRSRSSASSLVAVRRCRTRWSGPPRGPDRRARRHLDIASPRSPRRRPASFGRRSKDDRVVVLEHRVRDADVADVTAGPRVRHPRRGGVADGTGAAERRPGRR